MSNLAIIGASYLQLPLIEEAKNMGYTTHVFAWAANDVGEKAADYFYPISIVEKDEILRKCSEIGICGICSIASDLAIITVNYVANALNLIANSLHATEISTNKHSMRKAFQNHGDPSPKSLLCDTTTDFHALEPKLNYPIIVKPVDRSGSRGINKLESADQLQEAVTVAIKESFAGKALIEEYVQGKEYSVECISFQGEHHFLAVTEKFTTGEPHFIETGHREPAKFNAQMLEKIRTIVFHALDSLEIRYGASHSEIKIDKLGNIRIIEIGGRMGGDCIGSDLVKLSTGIDFVRATIQVACGQKPDLRAVNGKIGAEVRFIMTRADLEKYERLRKESPQKLIKVVDFHPEKIGTTTDSSNRAGCYIRSI